MDWPSPPRRDDSVTNAQMLLNLEKLTDRKKLKDIKLYEDIKTDYVDVDLKKYVKLNHTATRHQVVQQPATFLCLTTEAITVCREEKKYVVR